jgi:hypothetical protein
MIGALSSPAANLYDRLNGTSSVDEIDNVVRASCALWGDGRISDDEAQFLHGAADKRRPLGRRNGGTGQHKPIGWLMGRLGSRFTPRQRPRCPDRKASRDRRRMLGGSSALPDNLRHHYTEGQRSVLCIVAGEVKRHGVCELPIDKIAALAGVCRTTVQTAMHEARLLGHIKITERRVPGRKSLPNVVEIISREWRTWIHRGPSAARLIGSNPLKLVSTTKNTDLRKKGATDKKDERRAACTPAAREPALRRRSRQSSHAGADGMSQSRPDPRRGFRSLHSAMSIDWFTQISSGGCGSKGN